jgi:bifunctional non-homologous end joining protein LigD
LLTIARVSSKRYAQEHAHVLEGKSPPSSPRQRLATYRAKRNFAQDSRTRPGDRAVASKRRSKPKSGSSCVQKHLARNLHYDFRLEHAGVLLSWAVPKGPSLNPKDKRLAMRVETTRSIYREFEGVIPEGYGAGIVMLWDRGTWDARARIRRRRCGAGARRAEVHRQWREAQGRLGARANARRAARGCSSSTAMSGQETSTSPRPAHDSVKSFGDFADMHRGRRKPDVLGIAQARRRRERAEASGNHSESRADSHEAQRARRVRERGPARANRRATPAPRVAWAAQIVDTIGLDAGRDGIRGDYATVGIRATLLRFARCRRPELDRDGRART